MLLAGIPAANNCCRFASTRSRKNILRQNTVTGSARGEEQHGIFFADGIALLHFAEQLCRVGKLRLKLLADFRSHFITAAVNTRTDRRIEIAWTASEMAMHLAHSLFHNALDRAPPARVEHAHGAPLRVDENHRQAIRGLNAEKQTRRRCDESIAGELRCRRRVDEMDDVGMNLAQRDQWPALGVRLSRGCSWDFLSFAAERADFMQKRGAVSLDRGFRILFGESEIEVSIPIGARESARASGKSVDEPGKLAQVCCAEDIQFTFLRRPGRHCTMLTE